MATPPPKVVMPPRQKMQAVRLHTGLGLLNKLIMPQCHEARQESPPIAPTPLDPRDRLHLSLAPSRTLQAYVLIPLLCVEAVRGVEAVRDVELQFGCLEEWCFRQPLSPGWRELELDYCKELGVSCDLSPIAVGHLPRFCDE